MKLRFPVLAAAGTAAVFALAFASSRAAAEVPNLPPAAQIKVDFTRDVRPILQSSCHSCHGPRKQKADLRLDARSFAVKGGESGPAIIPGKSAGSPLIHLVASADPDTRMPAKGDPLTNDQIGILRAWIDQGAPWPDDPTSTEKDKSDHWSFKPVTRPAVPDVAAEDWPRNPIDAFILARLEKENLKPSPEADRRTLIRRLTFDLTGLPPAPAEIDAFLADASPAAYESLVDRLLASPRYGERWARHWLDVVRFGESHGFEMNHERPAAWRYRDYVVRSFNDDKPYDRFVTDQLAGDATGEDEATGFLVAGPYDQVKSPDPVLTAQQRSDELHDMVATTGSAFLGLTVGCARCHDHKFDPVSQVDYFRLTAVFAGVQHGDRPVRRLLAGQEKLAAPLRDALEWVEAQLTRLEPLASAQPPQRRPPVHPLGNVDRFVPTEARFVRFTVLATSDLEPCIDELAIYSAGDSPRNVALASRGARATASGTYAGDPSHKLEHIHDGRHGNGRSWISSEKRAGWVRIELPRRTRIDAVTWARDREGRYADRLATKYRLDVADAPDGPWTVVATSDDRLPYRPGRNPQAAAVVDATRARQEKLLAERKALQGKLAALARRPDAYAGTFAQPAPTHRLHRGDPMQKKEQVPPGAVEAVGPRLELQADAPEQQRRLALAKWVVDPRNPLAARVIANRLWHYHFGRGLVGTPSDFGHMGTPPTHPQLLDWLASEVVAGGWKLKRIHRLIVLSSTYRQAGASNPSAAAVDADASLLWRYPPRRLEAEAIRDAVLAVSGKLDPAVGGPGFSPFKPNDNYVRVYEPKEDLGPPEWRRMVYQLRIRSQQDPVFGAFDCPDAAQVAPRRTHSTTPLQALNLLNSRFMLQQANFFAERVEKDAGADRRQQVRLAFRLAFGREPRDVEREAAVKLINEQGLAPLCRALYNANEFLYVD